VQRLILVNGAWELISVLASLRESAKVDGVASNDTLLIYSVQPGQLPTRMANALKSLAEGQWSWRHIGYAPPRCGAEQLLDRNYIEKLRREANVSEVDELWVGSLHGWVPKAAAEAYRLAKLILVDDGMATYVPAEPPWRWRRVLRHPRSAMRELVRAVRASRSLAHTNRGICLHHWRRVDRAYLLLDHLLPTPELLKRVPQIHVEASRVRATLEELGKDLEIVNAADILSEAAVVIGQCLSNYDDLSWDEEAGVFKELIAFAFRSNERVVWKEHPRVFQPYGPTLQKWFPELAIVPDLGPWPFEIIMSRYRPTTCIGFQSTTLVAAKAFLGIEAFTAVDRIKHLLKYPNSEMAELMLDAIPRAGDAKHG